MPTVTWGVDARTAEVETATELDVLLDELDAQTPRRNTVPADVARAAMRHFLVTGQLLPEITWEEV
jgi:hypothetical protein